jgi:hypothetical protein
LEGIKKFGGVDVLIKIGHGVMQGGTAAAGVSRVRHVVRSSSAEAARGAIISVTF